MRVAILLLSLLLAACATPPSADPAGSAGATPVPDAAAHLTGHHWLLESATDARGQRIAALFARPDRPLQLDFQDGRVSVSNACNRIGASYVLQGGHISFGPVVATKRACADPALDALDAAIASRLVDSQVQVEDADGAATLLLATAQGDRLRFAGTVTAARRHGGPGQVVFLEVAPDEMPCSAVGNWCLQVRELHYDAQGLRQGEPGDWQTLEQPIEGFTHEPGMHNVLRVRRYGTGEGVEWVLELVVESGQSHR